jgi:hypothetical protein
MSRPFAASARKIVLLETGIDCHVRPESSERCSVPSELNVQRGARLAGPNASPATLAVSGAIAIVLFFAKAPENAFSARTSRCSAIASLALPGTISANGELVLASAAANGAAAA